MPARPPSATPFPYTTLFRSVAALGDPRHGLDAERMERKSQRGGGGAREARCAPDTSRRFEEPHDEEADEPGVGSVRSEEHTSELQSLTNLVCRLLLEKKKSN